MLIAGQGAGQDRGGAGCVVTAGQCCVEQVLTDFYYSCRRSKSSSRSISATNPANQMELDRKVADVDVQQDLAPAYSTSQLPSNACKLL